MITLALSLLAYQVANNWDSVTGGFNGLKGIPALPGLDSYTAAYDVAAVALIAATLATGWRRQRASIDNLAASAQAIVDGLPDPLIGVDRQRRIVRHRAAEFRWRRCPRHRKA